LRTTTPDDNLMGCVICRCLIIFVRVPHTSSLYRSPTVNRFRCLLWAFVWESWNCSCTEGTRIIAIPANAGECVAALSRQQQQSPLNYSLMLWCIFLEGPPKTHHHHPPPTARFPLSICVDICQRTVFSRRVFATFFRLFRIYCV